MNQIPILPIEMDHGPAIMPMAFVRAIVLGYRLYGIDPDNALQLSQISPSQVNDPDARVTAEQLEIMSVIASQELDDEALGWFSRKLPWGSYGMQCRASITSPNLGVALKRWCRHHRLLTDDILFELTADQPIATFQIKPIRELGEMHELCRFYILRNVLGYSSWAIDSKIPLIDIRFSFAPPVHADVYPLLFQCPVQFDSDWTGFRFDAQYLALPLRRDDHDLRLMLKRALKLTMLHYNRDRLLVQRLRQVLMTDTNRSRNAEALADLLHISTRTLHRQLHEEGASLLQLKNEARRDQAIALLNRTTRSIKQVAQSVGFSDEKSFSRAFKQWTGQTPGSYRERAADQTSEIKQSAEILRGSTS